MICAIAIRHVIAGLTRNPLSSPVATLVNINSFIIAILCSQTLFTKLPLTIIREGIAGQARNDGWGNSYAQIKKTRWHKARVFPCLQTNVNLSESSGSSLRAPTRNPLNIGDVMGIPGQARDDRYARDDVRRTIFLNLLTLVYKLFLNDS